MPPQQDVKKLERRAKAMLMSKDIPPAKMDVVRSLMTNSGLSKTERFTAIIDVISSCPDRTFDALQNERKKTPVEVLETKKAPPRKRKIAHELIPELFAPTETAYYVDELYRKHKRRRLFKKRWLVHRLNRLGIGLRKRLVPNTRFMALMETLHGIQARLSRHLPEVVISILKDQIADDPRIFNYIRIIQQWLGVRPFSTIAADSLKWMERQDFENELKGYVRHFYSFRLINRELREKIIIEIETRLRAMASIQGEKEVHGILMALRLFLPSGVEEEARIASQMGIPGGFSDLTELFSTVMEALVFQKPIKDDDIVLYYRISEPAVSLTSWDYSEDFLKQVGKDEASRQRRSKDILRGELAPFETLYFLLKYDSHGSNILLSSAENQWRVVDRKHRDPRSVYNENFLAFLEAVFLYFRNAVRPLLDGTRTVFRDSGRVEIEGHFFAFDFFRNELSEFERLSAELHEIRNGEHPLSMTRADLKKAVENAGGSDAPRPVGFVKAAGQCFYSMGKKLHRVLDLHRRWVLMGKVMKDSRISRTAIKEREFEGADVSASGRPFPYHDCTVRSIESDTPLAVEFSGKDVIDQGLNDGLLVFMAAFCYQIAYECLSDDLRGDLERRRILMGEIDGSRK